MKKILCVVVALAIGVAGCEWKSGPNQAKPETFARKPVHADHFLQDGEVWCFYASEVDAYNEAPLRIYKLREIPWDQILERPEELTLRANDRTYQSLETYVQKEKKSTLEEQKRPVHYQNMYRRTEHANIRIFAPRK